MVLGGRPPGRVGHRQGAFVFVLNRPERFPQTFRVFAFQSDLDAAVEHLRDHHVELPWGIEEDTDSRWVMFHDPAGNLIELAQFN